MNERMKIMIAYDGSECARAALEDLSAAGLPPDAEALILSVSEYWMPLGENGLHVSSVVREGDPKRVLIEEAEKWGADCIYIGAKGHRFMERMLLGSVSYAVAARAHCSVEVVRTDSTPEGWSGFDVKS